jgi:hypothetical protein
MRRLAGVVRAAATALVLVAMVFAARPALASTPSVDSIAPVRLGDVLEATVRTSNFLGDRLTTSLKSGLPAAIEMDLTALDRKNHAVTENRLFFRVAWDLWDEVVKVDGPHESRQLDSLAALGSFFGELRDLPVGPFAALDPNAEHRLRVECRLHPVAPRETERLTQWVAGGDTSTSTGDADEREVSVGLTDVIRFFYKGSKKDADALDPRFSAWFVPSQLPDEAAK